MVQDKKETQPASSDATRDPRHPLLLIVDDDDAHLQSLRRIFEREKMQVRCASDGDQAVQIARSERVDLVLTDLVMPKLGGLDLLKALRMVAPEAVTILMTAYGTVENAVEAMREGAYDFITKPVKRGVVVQAVRRALERQALVVENRELRAELNSVRGSRDIIGLSVPIRRLVEMITQVAPSSATVLVLGESGTGKELIARALHRGSTVSAGPFVPLNCAALPESILEAELFGVEAGAYTGATHARPGRFERADGGTLFLDEIGEMPAHLQVKILRALQEGEIERLGATKAIQVKVRVIAATNRDLQALVQTGQFRADLFYRLNVISLLSPPLRERIDDIPVLVEHFLQGFSRRHDKKIRGIERDALAALMAYPWPGNVRELENVIERAVVLCQHEVISRELLGSQFDSGANLQMSGPPAIIGQAAPTQTGVLHIPMGTTMAQIERQVIEETLRQTGGDKNITARVLGISVRTIYRRLEDNDDNDQAAHNEDK